MALSDNAFVGLTSPQLATLQAAYLQCLTDIATAGQSYTMGRTFTRANLSEVRKTLSEINNAIRFTSGSGRSIAVARTGCRYPC